VSVAMALVGSAVEGSSIETFIYPWVVNKSLMVSIEDTSIIENTRVFYE
jgi:hypothetical protein